MQNDLHLPNIDRRIALYCSTFYIRALSCLWCMFYVATIVLSSGVVVLAQDGLKTASAVGLAERLASTKRTDFQGKDWAWSELAGEKGTVVVFLGTQCPLAKLYTPRIEELSTKYAKSGMRFVAVDPNVQDSLAEMGAHARKHQLTIPFIKDPDQSLADLLGATRTPEVCVLDTNAQLRYRGRIDDQFGIGYAKEKGTASELIDAIEAILSGREVPTALTAAPGCLIGRVHHKKSDAATGVPITYAEHVAPVLQAHCVSCHREGDIGPMDLSTYEDAAAWADMIVEVTQNRTMPPWHATQDHAKFANDRMLSEKELSILEQWATGGTESGDLQKVAKPIAATSGWLLSKEPDLVIPMSEEAYRVPKEGTINYQYFRADVGNDKDLWVRGLEILPGARDVVHHVLVFVAPKGARKRDLGGARTFFAGYVPGTRAELMPSGYAKRIPANSELVFQVHYTPNGTATEDLSKLGLLFTDEQSVTHEVITTSAVNLRFSIPPGAANHAVTATLPEKLPECELLSFSPHMHVRGKSFKYTIVYPGKRREVVLDIPHYDFNWQTEYRLASPIQVPAGTRMRCDATFDNSDGNLNNPNSKAWVSWGDQTYEEMMIGYFHYAVKR
jgi:thiol-disulfide isomerase/thioredoxin